MRPETLKALADTGPMTLLVSGDCMGAALPDGSRVQIRPKRWYWPGEVVVYTRGDGRLVSHRFLGYVRGRRHWLGLTQSDRDRHADHAIAASCILGSLNAIEGRTVRYAATWRLKAVARYVPAMLRLALRELGLKSSRPGGMRDG